jgi:AcrR family transcriptional regulator
MLHNDDRRRRILIEATQCFLMEGFERASLDRIAAAAHVSKTVLYDEFGGKDALFVAVVRAELEAFKLSAPKLGGDLSDDLKRFAQFSIAQFGNSRLFGIYRANIVARRRFPELAVSVHEFLRQSSETLAGGLESARGAGLLSFEGTALELANRFAVLTQFGVRLLLGDKLPPGTTTSSVGQLAVQLFLHGCRRAHPERSSNPIVRMKSDDAAPRGAQMRLRPERFAALCETALEEFLGQGFERSSLDRIIAESGVSRATIYRQFGNKEGLFTLVVAGEIARVAHDRFDVTNTANAEAGLTALALAALDRHLAPRSLALHRLMLEEAPAFPDLARTFYDAEVEPVAEAFDEMTASVGVSQSSPEVARMFHALATHGVRYIVADRLPGSAERRAHAAQTARIFWRGLAS